MFTFPVGLFTETAPWDFDRIATDLWIDASANLFDAVSGGNAAAADAPVLRIGDKSGNGRDLKHRGTSGNAGTRKAAAVNGRDIVRLDGTDDGYSLDADLALVDHTILMAFRPAATITAASVGQCLLSGGVGGSSSAELILFTGAVTGNIPTERLSHLILQDIGAGLNVFGYAKTDADISGPNQFSLVWDNSAQTFAGTLNGNDDFGTVSAAGGFAPNRRPNVLRHVGFRGFNNAAFAAIDLMELVVVAGVLSTDDLLRGQGRLAHKWGMTAGLPSGHPYKATAPMV
ncbi:MULTISPECIES: hypothetical protein [Cyanophyceae]|uniref:Uncharacterized protein n=1 Tax=Leptolyngbya subtilissima DQ-A4 TaxID=2933933 RepID=A0ABV0KC21_9CYAN|nr:hypothetical protein [Nodosilinea sp. FACHB-141]MBD2111733.1 hypothetical protein [Nodosilinea sp. FACHB-141]